MMDGNDDDDNDDNDVDDAGTVSPLATLWTSSTTPPPDTRAVSQLAGWMYRQSNLADVSWSSS